MDGSSVRIAHSCKKKTRSFHCRVHARSDTIRILDTNLRIAETITASKQATVFHKFTAFQHTAFLLQLLCFFSENTKKVFSEEHSFSKNTVNKTHVFAHLKKHLFQTKGVIFGFGKISLKPLFV